MGHIRTCENASIMMENGERENKTKLTRTNNTRSTKEENTQCGETLTSRTKVRS